MKNQAADQKTWFLERLSLKHYGRTTTMSTALKRAYFSFFYEKMI